MGEVLSKLCLGGLVQSMHTSVEQISKLSETERASDEEQG